MNAGASPSARTVGAWDLRRKLLVAFCLLALVPALVLAVFSYAVASNALERKVREYSHDILFQTTTTLEDRLEKIEEISFNVAMNSEVQSTLHDFNEGSLSALEMANEQTAVQRTLASYVLFHDEINAIFLTSLGGHAFALDKTRRGPGLATDVLGDLSDAAGGPVWIGGTEESAVVTLGRQINSTTTQRPLGSLMVDVPEQHLFEIIASTQSVLGGSIMVVDDDGDVISAANKPTLGLPSPIPSDLVVSDAYTFDTVEIDGEQQYVAASEPLPNGWRVVAVVPVAVYHEEVDGLRLAILAAAGVIFLVAVSTAGGVAASLSKPIRQLSEEMGVFGQGDLTKRSSVNRSDEIGQLAGSFNDMADNIDDLVRTVYEEQTTKREIEVRSLRMQINPHFLYNTLETINWMARSEGATDAGVLAKSLGDLLRITIDSPDLVPLSDEITKLRHYLQIQSFRYGDRMCVEFDIGDRTADVPVPTLILQPLVENAIVHGIEPGFDGGTVTIRTRRGEGHLVVQVIDDGVGMPLELVQDFASMAEACSAVEDGGIPSSLGSIEPTEDAYHDSIGLPNVIRRVHASFPATGQLHLESELGEGTTVTLTLPIPNAPTKEDN